MSCKHRCESARRSHKSEVAHYYLDIIRKKNKIISQTIAQYGDLPLGQYLDSLDGRSVPGLQPRDDLADVIRRYTASLLGDTLADKVSKGFIDDPVALTANHHGVDYFAQSVQGSLLFALRQKNGSESKTAVPVFSCGNVPMDNLTYPLGLLLYQTNGHNHKTLPTKMPVFANSKRRALVSVSVPLDADMVKRAKTRISKMATEHEIKTGFAETIQRFLNDCYASHEILGLSSYSEQSVVINNRIWNRLVVDSAKVPEPVTLELEEISRQLLVIDLQDTQSLAHSVLFDDALTNALIERLNNGKALWNKRLLKSRLDMTGKPAGSENNINGCGTMFFWGINNRGRRIPLYLDFDGNNKKMLRGVDDKKTLWEIEYTEASLIEALNQKQILPSVFTCFLVIAFARGVACIGGYFQAEYLPDMQKGLVDALKEIPKYQKFVPYIERVVTHKYLSGMQTVMVPKKDGGIVPAGPLEIISSGGLTEDDIRRILSLSVRDAHIASLMETVTDVARSEIDGNGWQSTLAKDCARLIGEKIVTKDSH